MPTGYTAGVADGSITDFPTFAMQCARAFGALVLMRDDPMDAPIPDAFSPSDYHTRELRRAEEKLAALAGMTTGEMERAAASAHADALASWERFRVAREEDESRYRAMLAEVEAWAPPSPDHEEMKRFMAKQLTDSIAFDCGYTTPRPVATDARAWHAEQVAAAHRGIAYHTTERQKEAERTAERNQWVRQLRESLTVTATTTP